MTKEISLMNRWMTLAAIAALGVWAGPASAGTEPATEKAVASEKAAEIPAVEEEEIFNNWVEVGIGYNAVNGNDAQFQERFGLPADRFYGGIQDLHMEQGLGGGLLTIDGRFIYDNMDNLIDIKYENSKWGYVNFGYKEYRTWYDGSGGYFPTDQGLPYDLDANGVHAKTQNRGKQDWWDLFSDDLHIDRGEIWFEGGLLLPDMPQITFRYSHDWRNGQKGSTVWGDSALTGGEYTSSGPDFRAFGARGYLPSFLDIDETRDNFDLNITHEIGNTRFGLGGRLELLEEDNSRNSYRAPKQVGTKQEGGSATRYLTPIDRHVTSRDEVSADMWNAHAFTETRFDDMFTLTTGGSFTAMDTDIGGSRIVGSDFDKDYDPWYRNLQARDEGFYDLVGGAFMKQYVGNVNLIITPCENLMIIPAFRIEFQDRDSVSKFVETNFADQRAGSATFSARETPVELRNMGVREDSELTESLEIRYSGVPDWVFYVRGEWSDGQTRLKESEYEIQALEYHGAPFNDGEWVEVGQTELFRDTDSDRFMQKYTAGVNWYPCHQVNVSAQYYYKEKDIDYDFVSDSGHYFYDINDDHTSTNNLTGDLYPAFIREQDFQTQDVNTRLTWRPCSFLTSVTRYDMQHSTIDTRGDYSRRNQNTFDSRALDSIETAQMDSHIVSQSLTLIPCSRAYLQAYGTFGFNELETPIYGRELPGTDFSAGNSTTRDSGYLTLVGQSRSSYWTAGALLGITLDEKTSLQCQYGFYQSDNWVNNYYASMPYGAEGEEHTVSATLTRELTRNLILTLKYGYADYQDATSGYHNDYDAHMTYAGLKMRW